MADQLLERKKDYQKDKEISRKAETQKFVFASKEMNLPQKKYICPKRNIFTPKE